MRRVRSPHVCTLLVVGWAIVPIVAAELQDRTLRAYRTYHQQISDAFMRQVHGNNNWWTADGTLMQELQQEGVAVRPGREDGIISVPGGLLHHWMGVIFIPDVGLDSVLSVAQTYAEYAAIYRVIINSRLVSHDGDTYRVLLRVRERAGAISAVLDISSVVQYGQEGRQVFAVSEANDIREVEHAGQPTEQHRSAGRDSGYLWRASTFTRYLERDNGVYVELETLGLSRDFPALFGWVIEPIARKLGRNSVDVSLREFRQAVIKKVPSLKTPPRR